MTNVKEHFVGSMCRKTDWMWQPGERGDFPDQLWQYLNHGHLIAWLGHIGYQESEESVDFLATPDRENLEDEDISFDEED